MMKKKELGLAAVALIIFAALGYLWLSPQGLEQAPDIEIQTLKGETLRLSDLRGKPVLLTFWATTCPGCIQEMPHLIELHNELAPQGLTIIGVAMYYDPPNQVVRLVKQRQLPYTIALDIKAEVAQAFGGVRLTPTTFLIDPDGWIVQRKIGEMDMEKVHQRIVEMLNTPTKEGE